MAIFRQLTLTVILTGSLIGGSLVHQPRTVAVTNGESNAESGNRKSAGGPVDWVDEVDFYDYNARDGSLWSDLLEHWATRNVSSGGGSRESRVLAPNRKYIPTSGFYISKRVGEAAELEPHMRPPGKVITQNAPNVVTQFRPSQQYSPGGSHIAAQQQAPQKQREVSETDLYLLGAIEKLVFRVDYMEQRLRRTEQLVYYLMQGNNPKDESYCPENYTKVGSNCYHFGMSREINWQSANNICKTLGGQLAEFEEKLEFKLIAKHLLGHSTDKGKEFWLGGLNPGLLWIWSNSARPINANTNLTMAATSGIVQQDSSRIQKIGSNANKATKKQLAAGTGNSTVQYEDIRGAGRCLKLSYNSKKDKYQYTGADCSTRQYYLCEFNDKKGDNLENEISRMAKALHD